MSYKVAGGQGQQGLKESPPVSRVYAPSSLPLLLLLVWHPFYTLVSIMDDSMVGKFITEQPMDEPMEPGMKPMPKLHRFVDYDKPIHYLEELGTGGEGMVYHVFIEGKEYALKLVSYYELSLFRATTDNL